VAFDGLVLAAVTHELTKNLLNARVDRVFQPEREEIHLILRQPGQNYRLLLSAQAERARVHLTNENKPNPTQPPLFCMVLRKHLEGGRIVQIEQPNLERILRLTVESVDEIGDLTKKVLVCEIMGKHSNIILYDEKSGLILDGIKRYSHALSRHREVLPGKPYLAPPPQDKKDPQEIKPEELRHLILTGDWSQPVFRVLFQKLSGISAVLAREMVYRAGLNEHTLLEECGEYELSRLEQSFSQIQRSLIDREFQPTLVISSQMENSTQTGLSTNPKEIAANQANLSVLIKQWLAFPRSIDLVEFAAVSLHHLASQSRQAYQFPKMNELLDTFFQLKQRQLRWSSLKQSLMRNLESELGRAYRKLSLREESLSDVQEAERYRLFGQLLMTYLYQISRGMEEITLKNITEPGDAFVTISLFPQLTPAENAQHYFKLYNKARRSLEVVQDQLRLSREEVAYLESVKQSLELATTLEDLEEISLELIEQGYRRPQPVEEKLLMTTGRFRGKNGSAPKKPDSSNEQSPRYGEKKSAAKKTVGARSKNNKTRQSNSKTKSGQLAKLQDSEVSFMSFRSSDGYEILVGKNNKQNDLLTMRLARKNDVWLHVKEIPGSHVIIRTNKMVTEANGVHGRVDDGSPTPVWLPDLGVSSQTIREAALLAAYFSQARHSSSVPVDFVLRRHVRKPAGAKPGYVIYDHQQTIYVTPSQENLQMLLRK
jgi:predicted ribosome quality control (RQC) complex YloA/Tae2 family protein